MVINRKRASIQAINIDSKQFIFYPGNNIIAQSDEKNILDSLINIELVKNGIHVIVDKSKPQKNCSSQELNSNTDIVNEILRMSARKAKIVIEDILDIGTLNKIIENDKRSGIQDTVYEQLKKLELPEDLERNKDGTNH